MFVKLRRRQEIQFFGALWRASPGLAAMWWFLLVLRGVLPAVTSVGFGWLIGSIESGKSLSGPLTVVGIAFTAFLVVQPLHQLVSSNLGSSLAAHLYDRLMVVGVGDMVWLHTFLQQCRVFRWHAERLLRSWWGKPHPTH